MSKWSPSLEDVFGILSDQMQSCFERTKRLVGRPDEKGLPREEVVLDFLRKFLPDSVGVAKGYIINLNGDYSKECDVIVFRKSSPVFKMSPTQELYLVPIEDVYGVIEVKSILTKKQYSNCLLKQSSFLEVHKKREVDENEHIAFDFKKEIYSFDAPFYSVFCYEIDHSDFDRFFYEHICDNKVSYIFCLSEGVYSLATDDNIIRHNSIKTRITRDTSASSNSSLTEIISRYAMCETHARTYNDFKFDKSIAGDFLMVMYAYLMDQIQNKNLAGYQIADYIALWRTNSCNK